MKLTLFILGATSAQECGDPEAVPNTSVIRNGNKAAYTCDVGFCFENERTRTMTSTCTDKEWSGIDGECVPCQMCDLPNTRSNMEAKFITGTMDAEITCLDGVIEPGTDRKTMVISCIENQQWNNDMPTCSKPPVINCEDEYMEAIIDKNMIRAKHWSGNSRNIFLSGPGSSQLGLDDVDSECFSIEDEDGNYRLRINSPFMNQCGTQSNIVGDDYEFSNIVKWRYEGDNFNVLKEANVLDFKCVYRGVFMAGLPHKVKLAINTKTYMDDNGDDFTVSMSVYDREDFTGLVDNIPILHRGKRYYVDLHLHNADKGTPYLRHCYGSNNYVSEEELRAKYRMETASSSVRNMVINGCPAPMTLVRLEQSPNTYQTRFSFMFPKIGRGIADLQFVYLHCEIELQDIGFAPTCDDRLFDQALMRNYNKNRIGAGSGLGGGLVAGRALGKPGAGAKTGDGNPASLCSLPWMKNAPMCQRRRRRAAAFANMSVGFGPLVVPEDEEKADERPTAEALVDVVGEDSEIFASEEVIIEEIIESNILSDFGERPRAEVGEVNLESSREKRKIMIITGMALGCIFLFAISVVISSRVSCMTNKSDRKKNSKKISTNVLASQIQRELSNASNI